EPAAGWPRRWPACVTARSVATRETRDSRTARLLCRPRWVQRNRRREKAFPSHGKENVPMFKRKSWRGVATLSTALMCLPLLAGCGGGRNNEPVAQNPPAGRQGMSTKQKLVALAGAAALYYVYKTYTAEKQNAPANVRAVVP